MCLFHSNLTLNIADGSIKEVLRRFEPVDSLQADGRIPGITLVTLIRLGFSYIFLEWIVIHIASLLAPCHQRYALCMLRKREIVIRFKILAPVSIAFHKLDVVCKSLRIA